MFYYESTCEERECNDCNDKDCKIESIKYWIKSVYYQLYGKEHFCLETLESYLEELGSEVGVKLPTGHLRIRGLIQNNMAKGV